MPPFVFIGGKHFGPWRAVTDFGTKPVFLVYKVQPHHGGMKEVFLEYYGGGVIVYRPGTTEVAVTRQSFDEALAYALAEWPELAIRVVVSQDVRDLLAAFPQRCPHSG